MNNATTYNELERRYGKNPNEKIIRVLTSVELKHLQSQQVINMFNRSFFYLEKREEYERAAELKKIKDKYLCKID